MKTLKWASAGLFCGWLMAASAPAQAIPFATAAPTLAGYDATIVEVRAKRGHYRGRHWDRGRHLGWSRGKHRGWRGEMDHGRGPARGPVRGQGRWM